MSLLKGDNFENTKFEEDSTNTAAFKGLFGASSLQSFSSVLNVKDASKLILPENTATSCYKNMFKGCSLLTNGPQLPSISTKGSCYYGMFNSCTSLVNAPDLIASTATTSVYTEMFMGCTSLINPPQIMATDMYTDACKRMFKNCTSLIASPILWTTTPHYSYFYEEMFYGCSSLKTITCLLKSNSSMYSYYTKDWVYNVPIKFYDEKGSLNLYDGSIESNSNILINHNSSGGVFYKNAEMTNWETGSNRGVPSGWTVQDYVSNN